MVSVLNDLFLNKSQNELFLNYLENRNFPHLIISGPNGVGKTFLVEKFCENFLVAKEDIVDMIEINGSDDNSVDFIRTTLKSFLRFSPLPENPFKVVFIDEAENLSASAQAALRKIMDKSTDTRFIFVVNEIQRISNAILSRCFRLVIDSPDYAKLLDYLQRSFSLDEAKAKFILDQGFPDIREVLRVAEGGAKRIPRDVIGSLLNRVRELCTRQKFYLANKLLCTSVVKGGYSLQSLMEEALRSSEELPMTWDQRANLVRSVLDVMDLSRRGVPLNFIFLDFLTRFSASDRTF